MLGNVLPSLRARVEAPHAADGFEAAVVRVTRTPGVMKVNGVDASRWSKRAEQRNELRHAQLMEDAVRQFRSHVLLPPRQRAERLLDLREVDREADLSADLFLVDQLGAVGEGDRERDLEAGDDAWQRQRELDLQLGDGRQVV